MKNIYWIIITGSLIFIACSRIPNTNATQSLTEAQQYFLEIALSSEYGDKSHVVRKWTTHIYLASYTTLPPYLQRELDLIVDEINSLSSSIKIVRVREIIEANVVLFVTDAVTYGNYEPNAIPYLDANLGFFWVHWQNNYTIYKSSVYVNKTVDSTCQKHLLREEITQMLGLLNDSYRYPESIFYQGWTCTTTYTAIDKQLIEYILSPRIHPGMTREQVISVFQNW